MNISSKSKPEMSSLDVTGGPDNMGLSGRQDATTDQILIDGKNNVSQYIIKDEDVEEDVFQVRPQTAANKGIGTHLPQLKSGKNKDGKRFQMEILPSEGDEDEDEAESSEDSEKQKFTTDKENGDSFIGGFSGKEKDSDTIFKQNPGHSVLNSLRSQNEKDAATSKKKKKYSKRRMTTLARLDERREDMQGINPLDKREIMKLKLYKDQIKRPDLPMDRNLNFTEREYKVPQDQAARWADQNQKLFLDNFGIDVKIPTFFVIDSILWPQNCNYIFQLVKYVFPNNA